MTPSQQLKKATKKAHANLEVSVMHRLLFNPDMDKDGYSSILSGFFALFNPLECELNKHIICQKIGYINRTEDLGNDLTELGWTKDRISKVLAKSKLPEAKTPEQAIGIAYVLHGSRSGSPYIHAQLVKNPRLSDYRQQAMRFFSNQGIDETKQNWQVFKDNLDNYFNLHPEFDLYKAIDSAIMTFAVFRQQFAE